MRNRSLENRLALLRRGQASGFRVQGCPGCGAAPLSSIVHHPSSIDFAASDVDLLYAIGLPPEEAIKYFESKGYAYSWDWQDLWQAAQSQAFTVAKAMRMDVLQTIRDEVKLALDEGLTFADFQKDLEPKLKAMGWWGKHEIVDADGVVSSVQLGSPYRLKTIYSTNLQTSYMAGRYADFMENVDSRPFWMYQAMLDSHTRPTHRALNGLVFRYDDPFWTTHYPPNDWGCRCTVRALSEREVQQRGIVIAEGAGHLKTEMVMSGGKEAEVTVYSAGNIHMAPGAGWNYNPGAVAWKPDLTHYDSDIRSLA